MTPYATETTQDDLDVFAGTRGFFGHQSVGSNILDGVLALFDGRRSPRIIETRDSIADGLPFCAHAHVGLNGDPQAKLDDFVSIIDGPLGDQCDIALLKLCYADIDSTTDVPAVFQGYARAMARLEAAHPSTGFIYTTVPITTDRSGRSKLKAVLGRDDRMGPADNVARRRYNGLIRDRYAASGRLYDIAAVEASPGRSANRTHRGDPYVVLHPDFASGAGHLNDRGAVAAADELIRTIVSIRKKAKRR